MDELVDFLTSMEYMPINDSAARDAPFYKNLSAYFEEDEKELINGTSKAFVLYPTVLNRILGGMSRTHRQKFKSIKLPNFANKQASTVRANYANQTNTVATNSS